MQIEELLQAQKINRLDAEVLLGYVLSTSRTWLISHAREVVETDVQTAFEELCKRRQRGEPVAYLIHQKEFYGRTFYVDKHVLIPRPCTEHLIDTTTSYIKSAQSSVLEIDTDVVCWTQAIQPEVQPSYIVDIGTGSGCIAITLAKELPNLAHVATDISSGALDIASKNIRTHGLTQKIDVLLGDLLEPVMKLQAPFLVVSNPPYIPDNEVLMKDVKDYEPNLALFSGDDGSSHVKQLVNQCKTHPFCVGYIIECKNSHVDN